MGKYYYFIVKLVLKTLLTRHIITILSAQDASSTFVYLYSAGAFHPVQYNRIHVLLSLHKIMICAAGPSGFRQKKMPSVHTLKKNCFAGAVVVPDT